VSQHRGTLIPHTHTARTERNSLEPGGGEQRHRNGNSRSEELWTGNETGSSTKARTNSGAKWGNSRRAGARPRVETWEPSGPTVDRFPYLRTATEVGPGNKTDSAREEKLGAGKRNWLGSKRKRAQRKNSKRRLRLNWDGRLTRKNRPKLEQNGEHQKTRPQQKIFAATRSRKWRKRYGINYFEQNSLSWPELAQIWWKS
jgi:hypothetical protein